MKRSCQPPDASLGLATPAHDLVRAEPVGRQEDDFGPPNVLLRSIAVPDESFELMAIDRRDKDRFSCAHRTDSHAKPIMGILKGLNRQISTASAFCGHIGSAISASLS
jgi:hypothetical protein